jgi:hypothetical protein
MGKEEREDIERQKSGVEEKAMINKLIRWMRNIVH